MPIDQTCPWCGESFPKPARGWKKFCSALCRESSRWGRQVPAPGQQTCRECGVRFDDPGSGPGRRRIYCSALCRVAFHRKANPPAHYPRCFVGFPECEYCGNVFVARTPKARVCKRDDCQRALAADYNREWYRQYRAENGVSYAHDKYPEHRAAQKYERRTKMVAVGLVRPSDVFERDGWVCQLCLTPVDRSLMWPDPASKSLDHIVPVSMGGEHSPENVQLAHLGCNSSRSNRPVGESRYELPGVV